MAADGSLDGGAASNSPSAANVSEAATKPMKAKSDAYGAAVEADSSAIAGRPASPAPGTVAPGAVAPMTAQPPRAAMRSMRIERMERKQEGGAVESRPLVYQVSAEYLREGRFEKLLADHKLTPILDDAAKLGRSPGSRRARGD